MVGIQKKIRIGHLISGLLLVCNVHACDLPQKDQEGLTRSISPDFIMFDSIAIKEKSLSDSFEKLSFNDEKDSPIQTKLSVTFQNNEVQELKLNPIPILPFTFPSHSVLDLIPPYYSRAACAKDLFFINTGWAGVLKIPPKLRAYLWGNLNFEEK